MTPDDSLCLTRSARMAENIDHGERVKAAGDARPDGLGIVAAEDLQRRAAEAEAVDAKIEAHQAERVATELATENRLLETELAAERERSSANAFGLVLAVCIVFAALVIGGFLLFWRVGQRDALYANNTPPR